MIRVREEKPVSVAVDDPDMPDDPRARGGGGEGRGLSLHTQTGEDVACRFDHLRAGPDVAKPVEGVRAALSLQTTFVSSLRVYV